MNFVTGKHLPRRTFLKGAGASIALPMLDAMIPAGRLWRDPAAQFTRFIGIEEAMGCAGSCEWGDEQHLFAPAKMGKDFLIEAQSQLTPFEPFRDHLTVVSGTDVQMASSFTAEEIGGGHDRSSAVFLTQAHPLRKWGQYYIGKSIDQIHADKYGRETVLPSLQLTTEWDGVPTCEYSYHCAYRTVISWASPVEPLQPLADPRAVFEQLFGVGDSAADRASRMATDKSLLDWVTGELASLQKQLAPIDRQAVDQYTTYMREMERRIQLIEEHNTRSGEERGARALPEAPAGIPGRWEDHMRLMFDLQVLALQGDLTRVITLKTGIDNSNATFPDSGTSKGWHPASHHGNTPPNILDFNLLNRYRYGQVTYLLEKLKGTMEGDANLLDKTAIVMGSSMGNSNLHANLNCPLLLLGKANGALEGNLHLRAPKGTPMANVFVDLMQRLGHDLKSFGDSTAAFPLSHAPSSAASEGVQ